MSLGRLVAPLAYLRVTHPTKTLYDVWLPLVLGSAAAAVCLFAGVRINVFAEYGIVHGVNQLLQVLVGFYIAALAAVATFNGPRMDEQTAGDPLRLGKETLTRRRFACLLFGHLGIVGFCIYLVGIAAMAAAPGIRMAIGGSSVALGELSMQWSEIVRAAFAWVYLLAFSHLFVTTLYGLYYLAVRIHVIPPRAQVTAPPPDQKAA